MNNMLVRKMFKAGVDVLANAIKNDPKFLVMLMTSVLNENLAKQTKTFTEIVARATPKNKK